MVLLVPGLQGMRFLDELKCALMTGEYSRVFFVFFCFFFSPEENEEMLTNEKQTKTRFLLLFLLLLEAVACVEMEEEARKRLHQNQPNVSAHLNLVNILSFFFSSSNAHEC